MDDAADLRRLRMRSWRRGIKEMDLILGPFADDGLVDLSQDERGLFDRLLSENDHDLYQWVTARIAAGEGARGPADYDALLDRIAEHAARRLRPTQA